MDGLPVGFVAAVEPAGVSVAAGEAVGVAGSALFLSSGDGAVLAGVAEVNALDCAHDVSAKRKTMLAASARRFIVVESLLGLSQNQVIDSH